MLTSIYPNWPAPKNIRALVTTRQGGVSLPPYDSLNLASHVGDDPKHVFENRRRIIKTQQIPDNLYWLAQTHSTNVIDISCVNNQDRINQTVLNADGSYTNQANKVSVVLTADCLPVLFCSSLGDEVAAAHAGWRGLCEGILENTVNCFKCSATQIIVWLGPAIGAKKFEVGLDVKQQFMAKDPEAELAFQLINPPKQKYLADLYLLAKQRLIKLGISQIYGGEYCTYSQSEWFYSYRKAQQTGRMASMIWLQSL